MESDFKTHFISIFVQNKWRSDWLWGASSLSSTLRYDKTLTDQLFNQKSRVAFQATCFNSLVIKKKKFYFAFVYLGKSLLLGKSEHDWEKLRSFSDSAAKITWDETSCMPIEILSLFLKSRFSRSRAPFPRYTPYEAHPIVSRSTWQEKPRYWEWKWAMDMQ